VALLEQRIRIGVYRRLDNRSEGFEDDSPRALQLHNLRRDALHSALGSDADWQVLDWGQTDDTNSHEHVELLVTSAAQVFHYLAVPGLLWLGKKLAEKLVDETVSEFVKSILAKLWPKQESKQIQDFSINLPDGTSLRLDPPDMGGTLTVNFADGSLQSVQFTSGTR
jgi:hypothetical protein